MWTHGYTCRRHAVGDVSTPFSRPCWHSERSRHTTSTPHSHCATPHHTAHSTAALTCVCVAGGSTRRRLCRRPVTACTGQCGAQPRRQHRYGITPAGERRDSDKESTDKRERRERESTVLDCTSDTCCCSAQPNPPAGLEEAGKHRFPIGLAAKIAGTCVCVCVCVMRERCREMQRDRGANVLLRCVQGLV